MRSMLRYAINVNGSTRKRGWDVYSTTIVAIDANGLETKFVIPYD